MKPQVITLARTYRPCAICKKKTNCHENEIDKPGLHSSQWLCAECTQIPGSDQRARYNNIHDSLTPSAIELKKLRRRKKRRGE